MIDNLEKGTWLVVVEDGSTSAVQIKPDFRNRRCITLYERSYGSCYG